MPGSGSSATSSFALRRGEILGLAGLIGRGPDGTPRMSLRLHAATAARRDPAGGPAGHFPQSGPGEAGGDRPGHRRPQAAGDLRQPQRAENFSICALDEVTRLGWISARRQRAMVRRSAEQIGVKPPDLTVPITTLSGGNQQKTILGRWLLTQPKVLLLDDPTRGIDIGAKADLYRIMDRLCRDGLGIVVTSSELPELLTFATASSCSARDASPGSLAARRPASSGSWNWPRNAGRRTRHAPRDAVLVTLRVTRALTRSVRSFETMVRHGDSRPDC